jgi:two-component system, chemotaxis family, chemotaxis protein CheY
MATILVVDDSPVMQRLLKLMLQRSDHTVVTVDNGTEAVNSLAKLSIDLVITDVNMPEMDGLTLLQKLRADERYQNLPIIVLTASGQERIRRVAAQGGANGFLTRPTSSWELKEIVNYCLKSASSQAGDATARPQ